MEKEGLLETTSFKDLLTFENPKRRYYDDLIIAEGRRRGFDRGTQDRYLTTFWTGGWDKYVAKYIEGKPLIDLGGGNRQEMRAVAEHDKASFYCNVDNYAFDPHIEETFSVPSEIIHIDMLDFLSRLQSTNANFTINSIEESIIEDERYHEGVAEELARAMQDGSVVFGLNATALAFVEKFGLKNILKDKYEGAIFRK